MSGHLKLITKHTRRQARAHCATKNRLPSYEEKSSCTFLKRLVPFLGTEEVNSTIPREPLFQTIT